MNLLVIGGTRFIGRHVVRELMEAGHKVTLFHRGNNLQNIQDLAVESLYGDRMVPGALSKVLENRYFDAVIDMVAYDAPETRLALEQLESHVDRYLMISTASVYAQPHLSPMHETDAIIVEDDPKLAYGRKKGLAEAAAFHFSEETDLPVTVLRLPAVYGEYDHQAREWYFIKRLQDRRTRIVLPEGGCGVYHREYAGNVGAQLNTLLSTNKSLNQIYNSGHRHTPTYRHLVEIAAEISGSKIELYSLPQPLFPYIPNCANPGIFTQAVGKLESLGFIEKYDVAHGLKRTMEWFGQNPIREFLPTQRNQIQHFDYQWEDRMIAEGKAVLLK